MTFLTAAPSQPRPRAVRSLREALLEAIGHRLRWRTLWAQGLLLVALSGAAVGLAGVVRGLDDGLMLQVVLAGIALGWALSVLPLGGVPAGLVASAAGFGLVTLRIGQLADEILALVAASGRYLWRAVSGGSSGLPEAGAVLQALSALLDGLAVLVTRVGQWLVALPAGESVHDPAAAALVWSLIVWGCTVWAAWGVRRLDQPVAAIMPTLTLAGLSLRYAGEGTSVFLFLLAATLLLTAFAGHDARGRRWEAANAGVAEGLMANVALMAFPITLALVGAAALISSLSVRGLVLWAQRFEGQPASRESPLASSLGLMPNPASASPLHNIRATGLPNRHLIGSGPELSENLVMTVSLINLPADAPAPQFRWRAVTYDEYLGHGWRTGGTETWRYDPGHPAVSEIQAHQQVIRQKVRAVGDVGGLAYVAGSLAVLDEPYWVAWRRPGQDAFGASLEAPIYQAESLVQAVSQGQLRSAGTDYPEWVRAGYLGLPSEIPLRVLGLARDLTATAGTPYDRAVAIQTYLRSIPYTLDVPQPPSGRDVVDYFLFDLRRGYCDYYASAMVVLARAAGLPARLVVGYFTGTPERTEGTIRYLVTEADAHAWIEAYFPGYGWVEFDPTAGRPAIEHAADEEPPEPSAPPELELSAAAPAPWGGMTGWLGGAAAAFLLVAVVGWLSWSLGDNWRLARLPPERAAAELYRRLRSHAAHLHVRYTPGDTPYEFAASMAERITSLAEQARWAPILRPALHPVQRLIELHVRASFSPSPPHPAELGQAIRGWPLLSLCLTLTRLTGFLSRSAAPSSGRRRPS